MPQKYMCHIKNHDVLPGVLGTCHLLDWWKFVYLVLSWHGMDGQTDWKKLMNLAGWVTQKLSFVRTKTPLLLCDAPILYNPDLFDEKTREFYPQDIFKSIDECLVETTCVNLNK